MKIKYFLLFITIILLTTGCALSPYANKKYGELVVDKWFSDKELGDFRKQTENIDELISQTCKFIEGKNNKYVFKCKITYKEKGETVIPLSKNTTKEIYVVFIKEEKNTYDYRVYNSMYTKEKYKVWEKDKDLNY